MNVSLSPHIRSGVTTQKIMLDVIIALMPATVFGVIYFGWKALLVVAVSVASCVLTEFVYEKLMKLPVTVGDLSAVVTGLLLALSLYSTTPWWIALIGGVFAILIVKMLFGGIGQNFMNPALAARCFLLLSFSKIMTDYPVIGEVVDGTSAATPLALAKQGESMDLLGLLLGTHSGSIGETSVIAILVGAVYLIIKRVISPKIPLAVIGSSAVFIALFTLINPDRTLTADYFVTQLLGGGLLIGAFFMATDYTTTPVTSWGQVIFGVCVGLFTAVIRCFGNSLEGVSFAIIIANLFTPIIEKLTYPRPFGIKKERAKK